MVEISRSSIFGEEIHHTYAYRTLGLLNGIFIGLALSLGTWGISLYSQALLPTRLPAAGYVLAGLIVIIFTGTAGWLSARFAKGWLTVSIWFIVSLLSVLVIGFESTYIRTLLAWLSDGRFLGLPVYPLPTGSTLPNLIAGFFVFIVLVVLAFLQDYRLEGIHGRLADNNRLSFASIVFLFLPLPFVFLAGLITYNIVGGANAPFAIELVHEVIQTGRSYEGDLFELSRQEGLNYNALRGVKDMLGENYVLGISGFDPASSTVVVTAEFDNGAWIDCRVVNEQVGFCVDAAPQYITGFATLITGDPLPETCLGCIIRIDDSWRSWLVERQDAFGSDPQISKVVQRGTYTLLHAEAPDGDFAIECWFSRSGVIELESCTEVE